VPSRAHGAGPLPVRSPLPSPPHWLLCRRSTFHVHTLHTLLHTRVHASPRLFARPLPSAHRLHRSLPPLRSPPPPPPLVVSPSPPCVCASSPPGANAPAPRAPSPTATPLAPRSSRRSSPASPPPAAPGHAALDVALVLEIARDSRAEEDGPLGGAAGSCQTRWETLWVMRSKPLMLWAVCWRAGRRRQRARGVVRDAEVVLDHRSACRELAEQEGLLESAAAQQATGGAEQ